MSLATRTSGRITGTGDAWGRAGRTAKAAWTTSSSTGFGRHGFLRVQLGHRDDQRTFLALAGVNHFSILSAFERRFQGV